MSLVDFEKKDAVYLVPLGGLGEIGMNLMTVIYRRRAFLIDCGIMFPEPSMLGVDVIVPRIDFLMDNGIHVDGIVLTHGHEDHIGAVAYLLKDLKFPKVYGTPFTLALAADRLREAGTLSAAKLMEVVPLAEFQIGEFRLKSLQVTHSIVDSMGLVIESPLGTLVHSGDFKIDRAPIDGKRIDEESFRKTGAAQPLLLMSDSTNVEREGWSTSEDEIGGGLLEVFQKVKKGKIIVAVFASNIHRIQQIYDAAKKVGRRVALCGRSMISNVEVAQRLGYLKIDPHQQIIASRVESENPDSMLVIATGTQAEPRSALYRMSLNDHPDITIHPGDTVVMSSRFIPGNEKSISHLMNNLYRRGAEVIDSDTALIHASGHAYRDEQRQLISWVKPKYFLPVHGEYRMLVKHLRLAQEVMPEIEGLVAENGDVLELTKNSFQKVDRASHGKIFLDEGASDLHETLLRDRKQLAFTGVVVVSLVIDQDRGKILEGPDFTVKGVNDQVDLDALRSELKAHFQSHSVEARGDEIELEEEFRRTVRRFFRKANGTKPVVIPLIYEV